MRKMIFALSGAILIGLASCTAAASEPRGAVKGGAQWCAVGSKCRQKCDMNSNNPQRCYEIWGRYNHIGVEYARRKEAEYYASRRGIRNYQDRLDRGFR
jgi:hypothetical protein